MGYNTTFKGELKFTTELTTKQLAKLNKFLEEDVRDHPEWMSYDDSEQCNFIDLEFTKDFSGLKWNGAEKTYGMVEAINIILVNMREHYPYFGLKGQLLAQGENIEDRYIIKVEDGGYAKHLDFVVGGQVVTCPHCQEEFSLTE